jgi:O-antigen/teichoic acid export membrane protein
LNLLIKGSALRGIETVVAIVCGFITLPIMLNGLGQDMYGLWVLISSFTAMMYLFDLGFASAVTRNITMAISKSEHRSANIVINSALLVYSCISFIIIIFIILLVEFYMPDLIDGVTESDFKLVLLLIGFGMALDFPSKAFAGIFSAHYRYDIQSSYRIVFKVSNAIILIYLINSGYKIVAIAAMTAALSFLDTIVFVLMSKYVFKEMKLSVSYISRSQLVDLYKFSIWALFIDVGSMLRSRMDLFFIGGFVSYSAVSVYYIPVRLVDYSLLLLYKMLGITLPIFAGHVSNKDNRSIELDLKIVGRINSYFCVATITFYLFFGSLLLRGWMGDEYDEGSGYIILMILLSGRLAMLLTDPFNNCLYAYGKHRILAMFTFFELVLMLAGLAYSCFYMDANIFSIAISMSLPLLVSRLIAYPFVVLKTLELSESIKLVSSIYRPLILLIPVFLIKSVIDSVTNYYDVFYIVSSSFVISIVFIFFLVLEIDSRERSILTKYFRKIGRHG